MTGQYLVHLQRHNFLFFFSYIGLVVVVIRISTGALCLALEARR
jgi:hypothetical protein